MDNDKKRNKTKGEPHAKEGVPAFYATTESIAEGNRFISLYEQMREERASRLAVLLSTGYVTEEEARVYCQMPEELPKDRKALIVNYYLLGIGSEPNATQIEEMIEEINTMAPSEDEAMKYLDRRTEEEEIKVAERFVDARRGRMKVSLRRMLQAFIACSLEWNRKGLCFLRKRLQGYGYEGNGEELGAKDRKALVRTASYYLDLIELSILNGEWMQRYGALSKQMDDAGLSYGNELDEAVITFEGLYNYFRFAIASFYSITSATEAMGALERVYEASRRSFLSDTLVGTKFYYLISREPTNG